MGFSLFCLFLSAGCAGMNLTLIVTGQAHWTNYLAFTLCCAASWLNASAAASEVRRERMAAVNAAKAFEGVVNGLCSCAEDEFQRRA